jgi:hypothetical protein
MSFETLLLIVFFLVMPLLERLMKALRERQASSAETTEVPPFEDGPRRPLPRRPGVRPSASAAPPAALDRPAPRQPAALAPPPEGRSLEAAALARREAPTTPEGTAVVRASAARAAARRRPAARLEGRPRLNLRRPGSLRAAVIAQTVLGPCRALQPDSGSPFDR